MDWDEMACPWLEAADDLEQTLKPVQDALMAAAKLQSGETVLDVGCGTGPSVLAAAKAVGSQGAITGVDIAPPLAALHMKVTAGMMLKGVEVTDGQLQEVEARIVDLCKGLAQDGAVTIPAQIHVIRANAI